MLYHAHGRMYVQAQWWHLRFGFTLEKLSPLSNLCIKKLFFEGKFGVK